MLRIGGSDARAYLQDLVTNDVARLTPAAPLWAGLLSAQGKVLFDMILFDGGDFAHDGRLAGAPDEALADVAAAGVSADAAAGDVLVDVGAAGAEALAKRLTMYRLRRDVTVERAAGLKVFAAWGGIVAGRPADPRAAALGQRWIAAAADAPTDAGPDDYRRHRLALGIADSADLLADRMLWLEANAAELNGVSFTKGCYVGQENTARMHYRDKLRRRLLPVRFDGVPADHVVMAGGIAAGELRSHADGHGIAYLRIEDVAKATPLEVGGVALTVVWPAWLPALPATGAN